MTNEAAVRPAIIRFIIVALYVAILSACGRSPTTATSYPPGEPAILTFAADVGRLPTNDESWNILLVKPANLNTGEFWRGPYLMSVPTDQWGRKLLYHELGDGNSFEIRSLGKDGIPSSDDLVWVGTRLSYQKR